MSDAANRLVLVLNCGSSSIKFALFDAGISPLPRVPRWGGKVTGITGAQPRMAEDGLASVPLPLADSADADPRLAASGLEPERDPYARALFHIYHRLLAHLKGTPAVDATGSIRLAAVAHRVVHGGNKYFAPTRVDAEVLADLKSYIPLAPLHQPFALEAIEALLQARPDLPQVACFDTAFHHTLPLVEQLLPLPWRDWQRGLRRFGFHGLSYEYQAIALPERHGQAARGRTLVAHLGSGASLCAMQGLQSVATTMGFSALGGLMMGTRCGSIDPGVVIHLMQTDGLSPESITELLYHRSGLLGVSGVSGDPRELLPLEAEQPRVKAALELYVRRIVREVGALVAAMGGLDMLAFTGGIGEHNDAIRARVVQALGFAGLVLDEAANAAHAPVISAPASRAAVVVEATNEEWVAAHHATRMLGLGGNAAGQMLSLGDNPAAS